MIAYGCIAPKGCERAGMKPYSYTGVSPVCPEDQKRDIPMTSTLDIHAAIDIPPPSQRYVCFVPRTPRESGQIRPQTASCTV